MASLRTVLILGIFFGALACSHDPKDFSHIQPGDISKIEVSGSDVAGPSKFPTTEDAFNTVTITDPAKIAAFGKTRRNRPRQGE